MEKVLVELANEEATRSLGRKIARSIFPNAKLILLSGDLGAGKTTFAQGFIESVLKEKVSIASPTYSYVSVYEGKPPIYHFDLYRISTPAEITDLGLDEQLFDDEALRLVEWPENLPKLERRADIHVFLEAKAHSRTALIIYLNSPSHIA